MGVGLDMMHCKLVCSHRLFFCMEVYVASSSYVNWGVYNFQRWMSRFEQRWRVQRSAISIVNCRIPWADRDLNTYCTFGISLKVYVLQCLLILILTCCFAFEFILWFAVPHTLLTLVWMYVWGHAIDKIAVCRSAYKSFCVWSWLCSRHCGSCCRNCVNINFVMKLDLQTRWI